MNKYNRTKTEWNKKFIRYNHLKVVRNITETVICKILYSLHVNVYFKSLESLKCQGLKYCTCKRIFFHATMQCHISITATEMIIYNLNWLLNVIMSTRISPIPICNEYMSQIVRLIVFTELVAITFSVKHKCNVALEFGKKWGVLEGSIILFQQSSCWKLAYEALKCLPP